MKKTLRKVIHDNKRILKYRLRQLGFNKDNPVVNASTVFWWAKVQRKIKLLDRLCDELRILPDGPYKPGRPRNAVIAVQIKQWLITLKGDFEPYHELYKAPEDLGYGMKPSEYFNTHGK